MSANGDPRLPKPVFRLGVTGVRDFTNDGAATRADVAAQLAAIIDTVVTALAELGDYPRAARCYDLANPARLRCLSALAEGADQLFAEAALDARATARARGVDIALGVVLPFGEGDYKTTFNRDNAPASRAAYERLIARAHAGVLTLDGSIAEPDRAASYEAAGQMIARNCDLLIAVWDRAMPPKGRGGTADTVHFALTIGVPVWWIDASGREPPRLLGDTLAFWGMTQGVAAPIALDRVLRAVLHPPDPIEPHAAHRKPARADALLTYLDEPLRSNRNFWLLHSGTIGHLRRKWADARLGTRQGSTPWSANHAVLATFLPFSRGAFDAERSVPSQLAASYQHGYRTSYLLVLMLGAIALAAAIWGLSTLSWREWSPAVELLSLGGVAILVRCNGKGAWHERYIDYRLISELARLNRPLALLGWALPFAQMRRAAGTHEQNWVAWLAGAHAREAPLPAGAMHAALPTIQRRILTELIANQREFHQRRHTECSEANRRFGTLALGTFFATLLVVVLKIVLIASPIRVAVDGLAARHGLGDPGNWLDLLSVGLPAISAALFGIKAYEEFEQLAELSSRMIADLDAADARIGSINPALPLASRVMGDETRAIVETMLSEIGGWAQMFRARAVEE